MGLYRTNFREILIKIRGFTLKKKNLKTSEWQPFCLDLSVLIMHQVFIFNLRFLVGMFLTDGFLCLAPSYGNIYVDKNLEISYLTNMGITLFDICHGDPNNGRESIIVIYFISVILYFYNQTCQGKIFGCNLCPLCAITPIQLSLSHTSNGTV